MKKSFSTLLLMLWLLIGYGQKHSIVDTINTWNIAVNYVNEDPISPYNYWRTQIFTIEETIEINNIDYRKIMGYDNPDLDSGELIYSIREDSTGKVFYFNGNTEITAFDFGLEQGDTFMITSCTGGKFNQDYFVKATVDSVSSILLNSEKYEAIYLTIGDEETMTDIWVKGIGSLQFGLFYPVLFMTGGTYRDYHLLCMHKGSELVYFNEQFDECYLKTSIDEPLLNKNQMSCFSVGNGRIKINLSGETNGIFTLYSTLGRKIWSSHIETSATYYKTTNSGLYLYRFESSSGYIKTGKVLLK